MKSRIIILAMLFTIPVTKVDGQSHVDTTYTDTIEKHNVKQIDEHIVVQDTIIINHYIKETQVKEKHTKDILVKVVASLSIGLVLLSIIHNHKKQKNG